MDQLLKPRDLTLGCRHVIGQPDALLIQVPHVRVEAQSEVVVALDVELLADEGREGLIVDVVVPEEIANEQRVGDLLVEGPQSRVVTMQGLRLEFELGGLHLQHTRALERLDGVLGHRFVAQDRDLEHGGYGHECYPWSLSSTASTAADMRALEPSISRASLSKASSVSLWAWRCAAPSSSRRTAAVSVALCSLAAVAI